MSEEKAEYKTDKIQTDVENLFYINGQPIRDRILNVERMRIGDIAHNPGNWRTHDEFQKESYEAFLSEIGFAGIPLAYRSDRTGILTLIDGHLRKESHPDAEIFIAITDLNDDEADTLLAFFHGVEGFAGTDDEKLGALMQGLQVGNPKLDEMFAQMAKNEGLFLGNDFNPDDVEFKEFDESAADDVEYVECPHCGKEFPK